MYFGIILDDFGSIEKSRPVLLKRAPVLMGGSGRSLSMRGPFGLNGFESMREPFGLNGFECSWVRLVAPGVLLDAPGELLDAPRGLLGVRGCSWCSWYSWGAPGCSW